ncbi:MAG: flippase-like domain-containing protein [Candidatus Tectomicrobia bacterium]|uniref:Flippase-like domain-containing protein n=1 Tax=Tectimicrobiota bacterium TaxID=2528274 RepID=A0A932M0R5_UNCTE|nr:flippase-like domain-containing protein [Candidatus Tectomicrobia bacterium]
MKRLHWLRVAVSIAVLWVIFTKIPLRAVGDVLGKVTPLPLFFAFLFYLCGQTLSAYKWRLLAAPLGFQRRFRDYLSYYFIGMYFNLFLPTNVGGDVGRGYYLAAENKQWTLAYYSILAERASGTLALFLVASLGILVSGGASLPLWISWGTGLATVALFGCLPAVPALLKVLRARVRILSPYIREEMTLYWKTPDLLVRALLLSALFHLLLVLIHFLIGRAMGLQLPVSSYLVTAPLTGLAAFLPVSFNGIGIREAAYIFFLGSFGAGPAVAFSFGILWLAVVVAASLLGGGAFLLKRREKFPTTESRPDA